MPDKRPKIDLAERNPDKNLLDVQEDDAGEEKPASLDGREDLQKSIISAIRKHNNQGKSNDLGVVGTTRDQRNYYRGMQRFIWNEDRQDIEFQDDDPQDKVFNITQAYGKIFVSTFMGATPKVEPEADDTMEYDSIRDTTRARDYEQVWRKKNDISKLQMEVGRFLFTDGRIVTITEDREDGEYTCLYGALEARVPGYQRDVKDWTIVETEDEYPLAAMKRKYPDQRKKLNSGAGDSYYRNARLAVKRVASNDTAIDVYTGEDSTGQCTITKSYLTPDFYEHLADDERLEMEQMFPDGCCIVRNGDLYLESYPFTVLDRVDVIYAIPTDGANGPAIVQPLMTVQDSVNTGMNLIEETIDHGIPTTYYAQETDIDTLNATRNIPGGSRVMQLTSGLTAEEHFYSTPVLSPSAALMEYVSAMRGEFAQFVTGLPPVIQGFGDSDQKTASGQAQLRQMALGQMAIVWKPFTAWYTREMNRCVALASGKTGDITATLDPATKGGQRRNVKIKPSELKGFKFTNASDDNFPETYTERRNAFMSIMQDGDTKAWVMQSPDNLYLAKQYIGLPDLVIPGEESRNKQLQEIAEMRDEKPIVDPAKMPQQPFPQLGQPPVQITPDMLTSSIPVVKYDNDDIEEAECLRWINSPEGQEAKRVRPDWYQNVCLHCDLHTAQKQQKAAAMAPPPVPPPPPGLAISLKDLAGNERTQALAQRNIQADPTAPAPVQTGPPA